MANISGFTNQNGVPTECTVRVYERDSGNLIDQQQSVGGSYLISGLIPETEYDVVCIGDNSVCPQISGPLYATSNYFSDFIIDYSPIGYWRLNDESGTTCLDLSANETDGTINGSPTLDSGSLLQSGQGSSIDFDGINDYVNIPNLPFNNKSSIMVVAIVHPDSLSSRMRIIHKGLDVGGDRSKYSWDLNIQASSGDCVWNMSNGSSFDPITHSTPIDTLTPHLIIAGYDSDTLYISIDGVLETSTRVTSGNNNESGNVFIGTEYNSGAPVDYYNGKGAEIAIFDRILTVSEMNNLYDIFINGPTGL